MNNLILPDGTTGLIFIEKGSFLRINGKGVAHTFQGARLSGQKSTSVQYCFSEGGMECFGLKFSPLALKSIFNLTQSELTDKTFDLSEIDPHFPMQTLFDLNGLYAKKEFLERHFFSRIRDNNNTKLAEAGTILSYIHHSARGPQVSDVAAYFKVSYKYLERLFAENIGLSPKLYLRLCRFNKFIAACCQNPAESHTRLGLDNGYYDQMHLIKDMKFFTSQTPSRFFARPAATVETEHRSFIRHHSERLSNFYYT